MMMRDGNYTGQLRDGVRHGWGEMRYSLNKHCEVLVSCSARVAVISWHSLS